jgi:hypothetical protein
VAEPPFPVAMAGWFRITGLIRLRSLVRVQDGPPLPQLRCPALILARDSLEFRVDRHCPLRSP